MMRLFICFLLALLFHIFLLKFEISEYGKAQRVTPIRNLEIQLQEMKYIQEVTKKEEPDRPLVVKEVTSKISDNKKVARKAKEDFSGKKEESLKEVDSTQIKDEASSIQEDQFHKGENLALVDRSALEKDITEGGELLGAVSTKPVEEYLPPQYGHNPLPKYPKAARKSGYQGRVLLEVLVNVDGRPKEIKVKESSGYKVLDQAAVEAVQRWQFVPAKRGEAVLEEWVLIPIKFNLEEH